MKNTLMFGSVTVLLLLLLAGCSSDSGISPTSLTNPTNSGNPLTDEEVSSLVDDATLDRLDAQEKLMDEKIANRQGSSGDIGNQSAGSASVVTEQRDAAGFDGVTIRGVGRLVVTQTGTESVSVTASQSSQPLIRAIVRNGMLELNAVVPLEQSRDIVYQVTTRSLSKLKVDGSIEVDINGITSQNLEIDINGPALVGASGTVENQALRIAGSGSYRAPELQTKRTSLSIDGPSSVSVQVSELLTGFIDGDGVVEYRGDPAVDVSVSANSRLVSNRGEAFASRGRCEMAPELCESSAEREQLQ